jgi:rhamnogalacturonyl hydrolase YesR
VSRLLVYDTDTGEKLLDEPVPGAFITHVQFNPLDDHIIMYNHEWTASDYGIRRLWIYDCRSNKHIRVRTEAEERSRNDIVTHEVWERETGDFIYHGKFSQGVNKGCNFIGRVHFPKFPKLEGYTITEIPFPVEYQRNGHFNIGNNGWLVTDAYYVAQGEGKQPVGKGRWIALMKPDWDNKTLHWQLVCEHGSNWDSQEAHPHPVFDPAGNAVFFTSNKEGKRAVYRVDVSRYTQSKYTFEMPEEAKPEIVGRLLSERFLHTGHYQTFTKIVYPEVCTWTGALRFAQAVQDTALLRKLQERYEPLFIDAKKELTPKNHVDNNMFGSLPFMLYEATKEKRYFDMALPYADTQWALPDKATDAQQELANKGFTWQTRMWIDDMYMITIVQSQAYKATGDSKYIDRTAKEMVLYLDSLQRPNGLFYHAPDVPFFWGRGNGWMAAGMAELLKLSPPQHTEYQRIMKGYLTMMNSLKQYQNAEGLWNQLIDAPEFWSETSGSAMFTYAIIVGVSMGWLDANEFAPIAKKAWLALVKHINSDGDVTEVCVGTNKKNDRQYYYDRPRVIGDYHGQAAVLWCAFALLDFSL